MAMPHASTGWTPDKVRTLPDDDRPQIVNERLEWGEGDDRLVIDLPNFFHEVLGEMT